MACTIILRSFWGAEQANPPQGRGKFQAVQYCKTPDLVGGNTFWFGSLKKKQASEGHQGISFYVFSSSSTLLLFTSEQLLKLFPHHHLPSSHQKSLKWSCQLFSPAWMSSQISHLTNSTLFVCRSTVILVRGDGCLRASWAVWKDTHSFFIPGLRTLFLTH